MTGFGASNQSIKENNIFIEIKGVNHRYLDISVKGSELNINLEEFIKESVSKKLSRGKVDIFVKLKLPNSADYSIDHKQLKKLENIIKHSLPNKDLHFSDIKDVPGIFEIKKSKKINLGHFKMAFREAFDDFLLSKSSEGKKINKILLRKINKVTQLNKKILQTDKKNMKKRINLYKDKVKKISKASFNEQRIEQEITILALKLDVKEEIDRIFFHINSIKKELNKNKGSGKKIDFILQELFRESNTLTVKLDEPILKDIALEIKILIEEMREQIQNVE